MGSCSGDDERMVTGLTVEMIELAEKVENALRDNGVFADVYGDYDDFNREVMKVEISWGDWKHEHLRAKWIVKNVIGLPVKKWEEVVTEEDGSDCYSAVHTVWIEGVN